MSFLRVIGFVLLFDLVQDVGAVFAGRAQVPTAMILVSMFSAGAAAVAWEERR